MPAVRKADGLATGSSNKYLVGVLPAQARKAIFRCATLGSGGDLAGAVHDFTQCQPDARVDYTAFFRSATAQISVTDVVAGTHTALGPFVGTMHLSEKGPMRTSPTGG